MDALEQNSDDKYAKQVYARQVRTLYGSFTYAIAGSFLGAFFLMALQWNIVDRNKMLLWFSLFSIFQIVRAIFIYVFNKQQPDDNACVTWGRNFSYSALAAGLIWASGVYITFVTGNLSHQLTVTIITVGLAAGAVSTLSVLRAALIAYVTPIMLSLVILFLNEMTYISIILSISMFLTMLYIMRGANDLYLSNKGNFRLLLEAADREELLVKAKETAETANRTQSEFLDNMSHELRTPLHGIMGFAQVGLERNKTVDDDNNFKYFSRIIESGQRLKILLDDLLDLRKMEEGKIDLNVQLCDIHEIIRKCIDEQEAVINSHQLDVFCIFDSKIPLIKCDQDRIGQVVMNILSNAIKFSSTAGKIIFTSKLSVNSVNKDVVEISISDQGPGIPEEDRESVFNKFVQIKKNISNSGGTGLGLAITKEIIKEHKGEIWVDNNDTAGATFYFTLRI